MSATISLYKVIPNVTYTGTIYDKIPFHHLVTQGEIGQRKIEDFERANGAPDLQTCPSEYDKWLDEQFENCWSDGQYHSKFDKYVFYMKKTIRKNRAYKRIVKRLDKFNWSYCPTADGETRICIPVKTILYYQGWFFKKRFFKKKCTAHYCVTKDQIVHFFNQYITTTKDYNADFIRKMKENILNTWEDGMILEILW